MRDVGMRSSKTPVLLSILAELNATKGENDKALQQISRAEKLATEVLDGLTNHIKIAGILVSKSTIYTILKKYDEALACLEKAQKMIGQIQNNQRKEYYG